MKVWIYLLLVNWLVLSARCVSHSTGSLIHMNGQLVRILDNCTVGDDATCGRGECCVMQAMAYIPEYTGPKPSYQIGCQPKRGPGDLCYFTPTDGFCPCLGTCHYNGFFGHCV